MKKITNYQNVIFDLDGVVLDTNKIKYDNIVRVMKKYCKENKAREVVEYFTSNNGIPREIKINKFFEAETAKKIISEYKDLNAKTLIDSGFTRGFTEILCYLESFKVSIYILSGGDKNEVENILRQKEIISKFTLIMGGPKTKYENLGTHQIEGDILFIGDSKIDYEVASKFGFDFVFMYGYSQFSTWYTYFKDKHEVTIIEDCSSLRDYSF